MILVDTSVWISHLRGRSTAKTEKVAEVAALEPLLVGDLILLEILQGARDERHAARMERELRQFTLVTLLDADLAARGAHNYRRLRGLGITVRKTADLVIATFCIEGGHRLLHADRDFVPMEQHLGLQTV